MIQFDHVNFRYDNAPELTLKDICLTVPDGQFVAVVGHNGSGKSTLARHLNALLIPQEGTVTVNGLCTANEDTLLDLRRSVGIVFQNPDNQLVTTIVEEDIAFGPENLGIPAAEIRRRVDRALDEVGMREYALGAAHKLSGGQKQRIAIAGMLAMEPNVLVLDEATAMLDPIGRSDLMKTVTRLNKEKQMTVLMITQYMEEVVHADRVIVMHHGEIALDGTPAEIFSKGDLLREMNLDVPFAVKLKDELSALGLPLDPNIITVQELSEALCPLL